MTKNRLNCWEFHNCGRELGGQMSFEFGVCPASTDVRFDRIHSGTNAGRTCWVIPGTMCHGQIQGDFQSKFKTCGRCDFYRIVKVEAGGKYLPTIFLLKILKEIMKGREISERRESDEMSEP